MDLDAHLFTDEAALYLLVAQSTIRTWARRYPDLMPVRSRDRHGRPRYRLADLLDVERQTRVSR